MEPRVLRRRAIALVVASAVLLVAALFALDPYLYGNARVMQILRYVALAASAGSLAVGLALFYRADRDESGQHRSP